MGVDLDPQTKNPTNVGLDVVKKRYAFPIIAWLW